MPTPSEYTLAERPSIDALTSIGYNWLKPAKNDRARDGQNQVILRDVFLESVQRLNAADEDVARAVYGDALHISDNERWTQILRGAYSRNVPNETTKKTLKLIDFLNPHNNTFTVTNQLYVQAEKSRIPDLVVYVNGIPLVVIECKSPLSPKDKTGEAFEQIKQYEHDIPRLFYSNLFSIVTNGVDTLYGTTGAASQFWSHWKEGTGFQAQLHNLLEPSRLLDILAHFLVFERDPDTGTVTKKMCRYQQHRAVNKIVDRVIEAQHRKGLIWHTQGSGKSLTMVFASLKLKSHLTIDSPELTSPNLLVVTDRIDLDNQIASTFTACGLPNPIQVASVKDLHKSVHSGTAGLTLLSTIYKFEGSRTPVPDSHNWIVLVDECHRTQEKDLGAFLRATLPNARYFGFTGTPVKKDDLDTYANFGIEGEGYLDRYSIDDAVADGATVPIRYTSRKTQWQVDPEKLDVLFDQWFANEPEDRIAAIKERGVTIAEVAKHPERIELLAYDLWTHYRAHAHPDGYKAQVVAIDREAIVLYKRALDKVIAESLMDDGLSEDEAKTQAEGMSAAVYSANQEDAKPSQDAYVDGIRADLRRWHVEGDAERHVIANFTKRDHPLCFLIVCNKLLTGFDAPIESVMYLDNPLKEHNLLQAIARTNRVAGPEKQFGLIVDYIGVTRDLNAALASYREADVKNAMRDLDVQLAELKAAHREAMSLTGGVKRGGPNVKQEYDALVQALGTEDAWFTFRRKGKAFIRAYEALSPDPAILDFSADMKWVAGFIAYGTLVFEKKEPGDLRDYSAKIRDMLAEHLHVTGIGTVCKLRHITDPDFMDDFNPEGKSKDELETAAIRKSTELKKELRERAAVNPIRYGPFSERVLDVLRRMEQGQLAAADALKEYEGIVRDLQNEEQAYEGTGMNERAYGVYKILEAFRAEVAGGTGDGSRDGEHEGDGLARIAKEIDALYASDEIAPAGWHLKDQLRKELRQQVRRSAHHGGLTDLKTLSENVEDYALKCYVKVA